MNKNVINAIIGILVIVLIILTAYFTYQSMTGVESNLLPFG